MQLLCRLLRQAKYQLNMLRKLGMDLAKSSFQVLYGTHDYNANLFPPLGKEMELHKMQHKRPTWVAQTRTEYHIGNYWEHYCCYEVWVPETRHVRVGQTIFYKHKYMAQPSVTSLGIIVKATDNLCTMLKNRFLVKGVMQNTVELLMNIYKGINVYSEKKRS